jgi:hypothetical protein
MPSQALNCEKTSVRNYGVDNLAAYLPWPCSETPAHWTSGRCAAARRSCSQRCPQGRGPAAGALLRPASAFRSSRRFYRPSVISCRPAAVRSDNSFWARIRHDHGSAAVHGRTVRTRI